MKLHSERHLVDAMVERFPRLSPLHDQLRFGNRAELSLLNLESDESA